MDLHGFPPCYFVLIQMQDSASNHQDEMRTDRFLFQHRQSTLKMTFQQGLQIAYRVLIQCHMLPKLHEFSQFQNFFLRSFFLVPNASFDNERAVKIPNGRLLTGLELRGSCGSLELTNMESLNSMLVSIK